MKEKFRNVHVGHTKIVIVTFTCLSGQKKALLKISYFR